MHALLACSSGPCFESTPSDSVCCRRVTSNTPIRMYTSRYINRQGAALCDCVHARYIMDSGNKVAQHVNNGGEFPRQSMHADISASFTGTCNMYGYHDVLFCNL